jgi:hypothetical protein
LLGQQLSNAEQMGLRRYLQIDTFTHRNTDGPLNPYAKVYSLRQVIEDLPDFKPRRHTQRYMHAPPLPVSCLRPIERLAG